MARSLRLRVLVPLVIAGLVVGLAGSWFVKGTYERQLDSHMQRRGESIAHALDAMIRSAVFAEVDPGVRDETLRRIVAEVGDLEGVTLIMVVTGDPPRVVASTDPRWMGLLMEELPYERVQEDLFDAIESRRMHPHFHWETLEYDVSWPLALRRERRPRGESVDGAIMLHLDARPVRAQLREAAGETILALAGAVLAVGFSAWWLIDRLVLRRLMGIERVMLRRATSDETAFAPRLGVDEIGRTADSLNAMLARLDETDAELRRARDHLEEQVEQRTAALRESHERLRQTDRLATIGALAAGVAHDLNNLLLPMRSRIRVLEKTVNSEASAEQLEDVKQSIRFLQQLADSMRLCALDPTEDLGSKGSTDLGEWWEQVSGLLRRAFMSRLSGERAEFIAAIDPDIRPVAAPSHRLTQAVLNLLVNAGDACAGRGTARVEITATNDEESRAARLTVSDTGCGMPPEVIERAFDPFFSTKARGASSGLGLAMVRSIAESAGGRALVTSRPGEGTTFTLVLPWDDGNAGGGGAPAPRLRLVATTIEDERLGTLVRTALTDRSHVVSVDPAAAPEADAWVIESGSADPEAVSAFLSGREGRRVVILGEQNEGWTSPDVRWLSVSSTEEELIVAIESEDRDHP